MLNFNNVRELFTSERLEEKMFNTILLFAVILSSICIVWNIVVQFPFQVNYKWMVIIIFAVLSLKFSKNKKISSWIKFVFFGILVFVIIPYGWINSGGSENFTLAYVFLICISISFLFKGYQRMVLVFSLIILFVVLIILEHYNPDFVAHYDENMRFYDMIVQIPITLFVSYYFLKTFANAYMKERENLQIANEKLLKLSRTDSLTQVYNREFIFKKLKENILLCQENKSSFCLIMIDIDNFKMINDNFGHIVGDEIIVNVCHLIKEIFREEDSIIGRYGGDEFIIISQLQKEDALNIANLLLEKIEVSNKHEDFTLTISGGLVEYTYNIEFMELIKKADELLYKAKQSGKNMIST